MTATHHAEDVAGRLRRFVHNAVGTNHKLAQVGEFGIVLRKSFRNLRCTTPNSRCAQPQLFLVKYKHLAKGSGEPEGALVTLAQEKERVTTRTVRSGETDQHLS